MSGLASLPLHRKLTLGAAVLLFVDLFLPWVTASISIPDIIDQTESGNGWDGVGVLAGILALALIAWEVARLLGVVPRLSVNHDLVTAVLAGLTALFTIIQFLRALTSGVEVDEAELLGGDIDAGAGYAAWIGLVLALVLAYVAYLAFTSGGGREAIDQAREEAAASATDADRTQVEDSVADDLPTERPAPEPPTSYPTTADEAMDELPPTPPRPSDRPPMP
jgi:ABC-type amino acid transport system permease subunit